MIVVEVTWQEHYLARCDDVQEEIIFDDRLDYIGWLSRVRLSDILSYTVIPH